MSARHSANPINRHQMRRQSGSLIIAVNFAGQSIIGSAGIAMSRAQSGENDSAMSSLRQLLAALI